MSGFYGLVDEFGYKPSTKVQEGVSSFVKWYREYFKE